MEQRFYIETNQPFYIDRKINHKQALVQAGFFRKRDNQGKKQQENTIRKHNYLSASPSVEFVTSWESFQTERVKQHHRRQLIISQRKKYMEHMEKQISVRHFRKDQKEKLRLVFSRLLLLKQTSYEKYKHICEKKSLSNILHCFDHFMSQHKSASSNRQLGEALQNIINDQQFRKLVQERSIDEQDFLQQQKIEDKKAEEKIILNSRCGERESFKLDYNGKGRKSVQTFRNKNKYKDLSNINFSHQQSPINFASPEESFQVLKPSEKQIKKDIKQASSQKIVNTLENNSEDKKIKNHQTEQKQQNSSKRKPIIKFLQTEKDNEKKKKILNKGISLKESQLFEKKNGVKTNKSIKFQSPPKKKGGDGNNLFLKSQISSRKKSTQKKNVKKKKQVQKKAKAKDDDQKQNRSEGVQKGRMRNKLPHASIYLRNHNKGKLLNQLTKTHIYPEKIKSFRKIKMRPATLRKTNHKFTSYNMSKKIDGSLSEKQNNSLQLCKKVISILSQKHKREEGKLTKYEEARLLFQMKHMEGSAREDFLGTNMNNKNRRQNRIGYRLSTNLSRRVSTQCNFLSTDSSFFSKSLNQKKHIGLGDKLLNLPKLTLQKMGMEKIKKNIRDFLLRHRQETKAQNLGNFMVFMESEAEKKKIKEDMIQINEEMIMKENQQLEWLISKIKPVIQGEYEFDLFKLAESGSDCEERYSFSSREKRFDAEINQQVIDMLSAQIPHRNTHEPQLHQISLKEIKDLAISP